MNQYPEMCYVFVEVKMEIGVVKWGESGYYETSYEHNTDNETLVKELNSKLGVTEAQAEAMKILSMNQSIQGNDAEWQKKFDEIVERLNNKTA